MVLCGTIEVRLTYYYHYKLCIKIERISRTLLWIAGGTHSVPSIDNGKKYKWRGICGRELDSIKAIEIHTGGSNYTEGNDLKHNMDAKQYAIEHNMWPTDQKDKILKIAIDEVETLRSKNSLRWKTPRGDVYSDISLPQVKKENLKICT